MVDEHIGTRIAALRNLRGMTQTELAAKVGLTSGGMSALENGVSRMPGADNLLKIAATLGGNPITLVFGDDTPEARRVAAAWPQTDVAAVESLSVQDRQLLSGIINLFLQTCAAPNQSE